MTSPDIYKAASRHEHEGQAARIACILIADFALAAVMRANPELRERPFALTRNSERRGAYSAHSELSQVSAPARALGVRPGMTVAQARALIPEIAVINASPVAERAAADALIDVAESISPVVEEAVPGCVWVDLTGSERFYRQARGDGKTADSTRNPDDIGDGDEACVTVEEEIAAELARRAGRVGLEAAVGIAADKEIARLAARCGGARVIGTGREREFLNWMPLDLLDLGVNARGDDLELMLKRLGIRRLGDLAQLDARAVGSRLGSHGAGLMRLARGEGSARVAARPRAEVFAEAIEMEYGIETIEPLAFVMRAMIARISERLQMRGLVAGDITLSLGLADRRRDERRVAVAAPTIEVRALLTLVTLNLEAAPPPAAVETIRLTIAPRAARPAQSDMFLPPAPAPEQSAAMSPQTAPASAPAINGIARMVMRTMRPAEEVEVMCMRETPEFVRGANVCARVVSAAGPWRRQGEWWAEGANGEADNVAGRDDVRATVAFAPAAYARDYYDLALADGGVYRVYCDLYSAKWFVDGIYD